MSLILDLDDLYGTPVFVLRNVKAPLKEVYGALYHGKTKEWKFPAFWPVNQIVLADLRKKFPTLELTERAATHNVSLETQTIPSDFEYITTPYKHQQEGLEHLYRYLRAGLFYAPGLGKCKITVDLHRLTGDPMLILCPKVMLDTWAEEFVKHGNVTNTTLLSGTKKKKLKLLEAAAEETPAALITTYETASRYEDEILKVGYRCVIADESHNMKSPFAKRTQGATRLAQRAYRRVLLSGTPSLGSPFDLYGQLRFLGKYFCAEDWWAFKRKFGVFPPWEEKEGTPKMLIGFKNLELMNDRVSLICSRRTKEDCLDLPEQTIVDIEFGLSSVQKKMYNTLILDRCDEVGFAVRQQLEDAELSHADGTALRPHIIINETISLLGKLDQLASGFIHKTRRNPAVCDGCTHVRDCTDENITPYTTDCKVTQKAPPDAIVETPNNARLEQVRNLLETVLQDETNKLIIWARYRKELDHLENLVQELKYLGVRIDGSDTSNSLNAKKKQFNEDPKCRVYMGQVSTGIGITLNSANYVLYYNLPWNLEHYLQSLDRNHRIGQNRNVTVYRLLAKHTLDGAKAAALDQKINFSNLIVNSSVCATCPEFSKRCAKYKVSLYDENCIYDYEMQRKIAQVRLIP